MTPPAVLPADQFAPPHPLDTPVVTTAREVIALAPEIARAAAEPSEPPKE